MPSLGLVKLLMVIINTIGLVSCEIDDDGFVHPIQFPRKEGWINP
jgi:hypothetical protein